MRTVLSSAEGPPKGGIAATEAAPASRRPAWLVSVFGLIVTRSPAIESKGKGKESGLSRLALSYATDRGEIAKLVNKGVTPAATGPVPKSSPYFQSTTEPSYDPNKAKPK